MTEEAKLEPDEGTVDEDGGTSGARGEGWVPSSSGGYPIAGWFIWKHPNKMDDDWGR